MKYDSNFMNIINRQMGEYLVDYYGFDSDFTYTDTHIQINNYSYPKMEEVRDLIYAKVKSFYEILGIDSINVCVEEIGDNLGETLYIYINVETY